MVAEFRGIFQDFQGIFLEFLRNFPSFSAISADFSGFSRELLLSTVSRRFHSTENCFATKNELPDDCSEVGNFPEFFGIFRNFPAIFQQFRIAGQTRVAR